jgi:hypothetical protein
MFNNNQPPPNSGPMFNNRPPINPGPNINNRPPINPGPNINNRPPINPGPNNNNRPIPPRTGVSNIPNQQQHFQALTQNNRPYQGPSGPRNPQSPPPPSRQVSSNSTTSPSTQINQNIPQMQGLSNHNPNSNVQVNLPGQNVQQRRAYSQKDLPNPPPIPKKSSTSISHGANSIKTKFASIGRTISTLGRKQEKKRRMSQFGGINVNSAYRNSMMQKPVFESQLLLKPQNPNFIISLGMIVMVASVSLAIAFVALKNGGLTEANIYDISKEDTFGFIFLSMFLAIIALTGYIAYNRKWTSLLITYCVFIVFAFIVQIIIISLFLQIYFNPVNKMREKWVNVFTETERQNIQVNYDCCGFLSIRDHSVTTPKCSPDTGSTLLNVRGGKTMNSFSYIDLSVNSLYKRQDVVQDPAAAQPVAQDAGAQDAGAQAAQDPAAAQPVAQDAGAQDAGAQAAQDPAAAQPVAQDTGAQDAGAQAGQTAGADPNTTLSAEEQKMLESQKQSYKCNDEEIYKMEDVMSEGCANIIIKAVKKGLLQYILIECVMAILFIVAFYYAILHFKEQIEIEKEIDSARATFG